MAKTIFTICGIDVTINTKHVGKRITAYGVNNTFRVNVKTKFGKTYFLFNDSINNCNNGIKELDDNATKKALHCFLFDAIAYENTYNFADFYSEFGFDCYKDEIKAKRDARKAYNGCKKHSIAANRIFDGKTNELYEELEKEGF